MAIAKCGGLILDGSTLKMVNGIVTVSGGSPTSGVVANCGGILFDATYFVDVILNGNKDNVSVYYGLDIGLANTGLNEAYNAQYIDHKVIERDGSYVVLSKQNQGRPLLLESGCLNELDSYSTDGFQFFGLTFKNTNIPEALFKDHLANENYQYELGYIAFKTKTVNLNGNYKVTFYHHVQDNYFTFPTQVVDFSEIKKLKNK